MLCKSQCYNRALQIFQENSENPEKFKEWETLKMYMFKEERLSEQSEEEQEMLGPCTPYDLKTSAIHEMHSRWFSTRESLAARNKNPDKLQMNPKDPNDSIQSFRVTPNGGKPPLKWNIVDPVEWEKINKKKEKPKPREKLDRKVKVQQSKKDPKSPKKKAEKISKKKTPKKSRKEKEECKMMGYVSFWPNTGVGPIRVNRIRELKRLDEVLCSRGCDQEITVKRDGDHYHIIVPIPRRKGTESLDSSRLRVMATDPGICTFQTTFDGEKFVEYASGGEKSNDKNKPHGSIQRLFCLGKKMDKLQSKMDQCKKEKDSKTH